MPGNYFECENETILGKKKGTRESCLVRGYWGDIIISPYIGYGVETDS